MENDVMGYEDRECQKARYKMTQKVFTHVIDQCCNHLFCATFLPPL